MNKLEVEIGETFLGGSGQNLKNTEGVGVFVSNFFAGAISVAGIILLFLLVGGGIAIIAGAGKNDPQTVQKGKLAATSALIGFVVVFSAYWIVKLVESITGLDLIGGIN